MNNKRFRRALWLVGRIQRLRGKITRDEWKKIKDVVRNPIQITATGEEINLVEEVREEFAMNLVIEGRMNSSDDLAKIEWDNLLNWIKEMLPMILEFIKALLAIF